MAVATQGRIIFFKGADHLPISSHLPQLPIIAVHHRAPRNSPSRAEWYRSSENGRARNSKSKPRNNNTVAVQSVDPSTAADSSSASALGGNYHCFDEISLGNRLRCEKIGRLESVSGQVTTHRPRPATTATFCWLRMRDLKPVVISLQRWKLFHHSAPILIVIILTVDTHSTIHCQAKGSH